MKQRLALLLALLANTAFADSRTISNIGIDSKVTGLDGSMEDALLPVNIGQAERLRSAKAGYDLPENSAPNTVPFAVYYQSTAVEASPNDAIGDDGHATEVAGVMIGRAMPNATFEGVAPGAQLYSLGFGDYDDDNLIAINLQILARKNVTPEIKAINLSFGGHELVFGEEDGRSVLSQFIDWSARRHDVLYVVAGARDFDPSPRGKPDDSFNSITVGSSDLDNEGNSYSTFGGHNATPDFTGTERGYIDILAPGEQVQVYGPGAEDRLVFGTSYAASHVTGTVALLQQYKHQQNKLLNDRFLLEVDHNAYKAILMNSADKKAGVHGSTRDVKNHLNQLWEQTPAATNPAIAVDSGMGTGHLNARAAVQQFSSGWYQSTGELTGATVPHVAWSEQNIAPGGTEVYVLDGTVAAGAWVSITLCWDRVPHTTSGGLSYSYGEGFDTFADNYDIMPDLDLFFKTMSGTTVFSSESATENTEHIFFQLQTAGSFKIEVRHLGGLQENTKFGLAWWIGDFAGNVPGDFDGNGSVGPEDYNVWRSGFGTSIAAGTGADGNGNGVIDAADYVIWRNATGAGSGSSNFAPVPEPTGALLAIMGLIFVFGSRRSADHG